LAKLNTIEGAQSRTGADNTCDERESPDAELRRCEQAITENPGDAAAYYKRGNVLQRLGRLDEAVESYRQAIARKPDHASSHTNLGYVLRKLGRFEEALSSHETAIALLPNHPGLHLNRGNALHGLKRFDDAVQCYNRAIALRPDYPEAAFNRATLNLLLGNFATGWQGYEARKRNGDPKGSRKFGKPLWLGKTNISGKTILVHWEQGFGDVIQFSRYVRLLEMAGARVLFAPQRELRTLMRGLDARARIVDIDTDTLFFDCHCPVMSLPLAFKTEIGTIPKAPYLSADGAKVAFWRKRLGDRTKPRIGVVWTGNARPDKGRSIRLEQFQRLFSPRFKFICLQKNIAEAERAVLNNAEVLYPGDEFIDFSDTAALCVLMDLVISIDTSIAHLAGALGVRSWALLPWLADWRWLLDGDDTPWYPSMRLFRQKTWGDWAEVMERVALELHCQGAPAAATGQSGEEILDKPLKR
jgi:tetratricopeptide (TPR) repeat protein